MKILHYLILGALAVSLAFITDDCGKDRWDIKTLTDASAKTMSYKVYSSSIKKLIRIKSGIIVSDRTSRQFEERKVYSIVCRVSEYRKEDDGDYHLVLVDTKDSGITMVGEIPDPECDVMPDCFKLTEIVDVRNYFYFQMKQSGNKVTPGMYKVTGVFFFDKIHGQLGCAPNGAELHPVLEIKKLR